MPHIPAPSIETGGGRDAADALVAMPLPASFDPDGPDQVLVDTIVEAARAVEPNVTIDALYRALGRRGRAIHLHVGGPIFHCLEGDGDEPDGVQFDKRYGLLLRVATRLDPVAALELHERAESLYRRHGRSLVRYHRLGTSTRNAVRLIEEFAAAGLATPAVTAQPDEGFERRACPLGAAVPELLGRGSPDGVLLHVELPEPRRRTHRPLSAHDDSAAAAPHWIDQPEETPVESLAFYLLDDARITARPSCIVFGNERTGHRLVGQMSDMYHHSAAVGRVGLGDVGRRVPLAYLMPRFGPPNNHYHSIVDKMSGLAGYHLLGLDCPVVAAVAPNAIERRLMGALGIDPDAVIVDEDASIAIERGILARQIPLRPVFYELCAALPRGESPCGPDVYISRGAGGARVMVNESEVETLLRERGFDIVRMEEHAMDVQLAIAANARRIVGPHGAGLANAVFASRGCALLELLPAAYMNSCYARLALDCGHRYGVLIGDTVADDDDAHVPATLSYRIDTDALVRVLDDDGAR